ncbi:M28 family metallopeptidase [Antrihabitans cavernicola]|uniref:M28 family peptidase n=1 Tax=Antrihabitans cavernicola TaxID=2495913 RepID=A0A5A7SBA2_9NOCA|nr:M28 family metallopeptidase [Spelaeibacter cavernicola]KAA0022127.1 M28 family peptidase [Spelaeibacter cavernicola]
MRRSGQLLFVGLAATLVASGCTRTTDDSQTTVTPEKLASSMTTDALVGHLEKLESIAKDNGGNRSVGTPGYDRSVDYVVGRLKDKGFDVTTPEFDVKKFDIKSESLKSGDRNFELHTLSYSPATPVNGLTARLAPVPADDSPGCTASDYDGIDARGAIALVPRGVCPFVEKQRAAAERGAAAVIIVNNTDGPLGGTLDDKDVGAIPVVSVSTADGPALAALPEVTLVVDAATTQVKTRNIIAQTKTGSTDDVVMAGAHLDSVPEGPGINDNGTGTAAVLETALQLGSSPDLRNAVRFAWWGGEELGLLGSTDYVAKLSDADRLNIALYMNFDMLGSPNPAYLTYDGDDSDHQGEPAGPKGSAGIERTFNAFLLQNGITPEGTDFDGRSDYGPFVEHGIPSGGLFSGAEEKKTPEQVQQWGGTADQAYDENYHAASDILANVDRDAFTKNAAAVAYGVGMYANSIGGPNGVPGKSERPEARDAEK